LFPFVEKEFHAAEKVFHVAWKVIPVGTVQVFRAVEKKDQR